MDIYIRSKNLLKLPYSFQSGVYNGVTFTILLNGSIEAKGTATDETYFNMAQIDFGTESCFSGNGTANGLYFSDCIYNANNKISYLYVPKGMTIDKIYYPMVNKGETALPYESPSKVRYVVYERSRNLLNKDTIINVASGASNLYLENGKTYTISCVSKINDSNIWIDIRPAGSGYVNSISISRCYFNKNGQIYKTTTVPDDGVQYCIGFCVGGSPNAAQWNNMFNETYCENIMINEGSILPYESYAPKKLKMKVKEVV